jgi:LPXTG-motif cell wall-anchored protein
MKRIVLSIALVLTLCLSASAQSDGFFASTYQEYGKESRAGAATPGLPGVGTDQDQSAPLGSGLLLLAGMGAAYALRRKNK